MNSPSSYSQLSKKINTYEENYIRPYAMNTRPLLGSIANRVRSDRRGIIIQEFYEDTRSADIIKKHKEQQKLKLDELINKIKPNYDKPDVLQ